MRVDRKVAAPTKAHSVFEDEIQEQLIINEFVLWGFLLHIKITSYVELGCLRTSSFYRPFAYSA